MHCSRGALVALAFSMAALFFCGPSVGIALSEDAGGPQAIRETSDLNRRRLGVISGTSLDLLTEAALDFTYIEYFDTPEQQIAALRSGEIDALIDDLPINMLLVEDNPDLYLLPEILVEDRYAFAFRLDDTDLFNQINSEIRAMLADGTMEELKDRWINGDAAARVMPDYSGPGGGFILRYGISPISPPFCYETPDGKPMGLEVELIQRIADKLDFRLEIVSMNFNELIPALMGGKVDVISSCLSITPEREETMRFTASHYTGGVSAVVLRHP